MNAEIRRYIWSDLSTTRLVLGPVVLGFTFYSLNVGQGPQALMIWVNSIMAILCIWAMGQSALSVSEEVTRNTWDWQRLSPQGAFSLAIGKIFGAPVFQWYCVLICFVFYLMAASALDVPFFAVAHWVYHWMSAYIALLAFSVMNSVESARTLRAVRRPTNRFARGIFLFFVLSSVYSGLTHSFFRSKNGVDYEALLSSTINWWGFNLPLLLFIDVSLFVWTAWCVVGCYRALRAELQFRFGPWAWLGFLFYVALYFTPLVSQTPSLTLFFFVLFCTAATGTYVNLFREDKDTVSLRKVLSYRPGEVFPSHLVSCWLCSFPVMLLALAAILLLPGDLQYPMFKGVTDPMFKGTIADFRVIAVIVTLFIIRDGCLLLSIHLRNPRHPRNDLAFAFYLACLYAIVPGCIAIISIKSVVLPLFWPGIGGVKQGWWSAVLALPLCFVSIYLFSSALFKSNSKSS